MERWKNCPASVRLSKDVPRITSEHAKLGTHAHEIAEQMLKEGPESDAFFELSESEVFPYVKIYVDLIRKEAATADEAHVEKGFNLSTLHPQLFGTCDAIHFYKKQSLLRVYDYKHGSGKPVKPEKNDQLLYYALGALLEISHPVDTAELVIVQPRCPRGGEIIHRWQFKVRDVMWDFAFELIAAAKRTEDPDAAIRMGNWCWFCGAVSLCPEKLKEKQLKAKDDFAVVTWQDVL
jgi:hypothetical protein